MRHQEPAFHEELELLMSSESGSGISHTGDGWTRALAVHLGTWRHLGTAPGSSLAATATGEFLQGASWLLPAASFSRLGCVSVLLL